MYAAAGGASLASRQARKRQAQQNTKKAQQQAKDKLAQIKATADAPVSPTKSKHFHQLPASYLKAPHAHTRKFSAGYSTQSKLLLPISEQQATPTAQQAHTNHHYIQHQHNLQLKSQREERCQRLKKSATATLPLSQQAQDFQSPPTPTICFNTNNENICKKFNYSNKVHDQSLSNLSQHHYPHTHAHPHHSHTPHHHQHHQPIHLQIPLIPDPIIVTPATPLPSPASGYNPQQQLHHAAEDLGGSRTLQHPTTLLLNTTDATSTNQLERKCSINRGRKLDPFEENFYKTTTITTAQEFYNDDYVTVYDGLPNGGNKWEQTANANEYCDSEHRHIGVCTCDHTECAQGRAAWLERGRRCSVQENAASCHRRWVKRNRIQDSSLGGSSDDEDLLGVLRGPSSFANAFLYVGLGTIAIGLVIAFVGTGEKGFKTVELRLIGPSLIGIGLVCCILRILFCVCPSHCLSSSRRNRNKKNAKIDADHRTSLLRSDSKRVQIARGSQSLQPKQTPPPNPMQPKSIVKNKSYEGVEALKQIATTSLFLENEQKLSSSRIVPIIKEPENNEEPPLELTKIDPLKIDTLSIIDIISLSDAESESDHEDDELNDLDFELQPTTSTAIQDSHHLGPQRQNSKLSRQRKSVNQRVISTDIDSDTLLMETSLMIINPTSTSSSATPTSAAVSSSSPLALSLSPPPSLLPPATSSSSSLLLLPPAGVHKTENLSLILKKSNQSSATPPPPPKRTPSQLPSTSYALSPNNLSPPPAAILTAPSTSSHPAMASMAVPSSSSSSMPPPPPPTTTSPTQSQSQQQHQLAQPQPPSQPQQQQQQQHTVTVTTSEPELVLSPAKLGQ